MKYPVIATDYDILNNEPEKPFLKDLRKDLKNIDEFNTKKDALKIKKALLLEITNSL